MSGQNNSLMDYRNEISAATNKGWPLIPQNQDFTGHPNKQYTINVGTVLNGQNTPQINWNSPLVPDSILSSNGLIGTTTSSSSTDSGMNGWTIAGLAISALGVAGSIAAPIISLIKSKKDGNTQGSEFSKAERKEITRNTTDSNDSMTALNSCINTANGVDENTSSETLVNINNNLTDAITNAENQKSEALRNAKTAKATKGTKVTALQTEQAVMDGLLNQKTEIGANIDEQQKILDDPNASDEAKNNAKKLLEEYKNSLKEVEKQIKESDKKIKQLESDIALQDEIIEQNTNTANTIETRLKAARAAASKVNNMIEQK